MNNKYQHSLQLQFNSLFHEIQKYNFQMLDNLFFIAAVALGKSITLGRKYSVVLWYINCLGRNYPGMVTEKVHVFLPLPTRLSTVTSEQTLVTSKKNVCTKGNIQKFKNYECACSLDQFTFPVFAPQRVNKLVRMQNMKKCSL